MKKIAALTLIPLLTLTLSACGKDNSSSKDSSNKSSAKVESNSPVTLDKYLSIKVGLNSPMTNNDGDTIKSVEAKFGKPTSVTKTEVNGKTVATYTWGKLNQSFKADNVTVSFDAGHANSKSYTSLSADKLKPIDKKKVDALKNGSSYEEVVKALGQPNAAAESSEGSLDMNSIVYLTDKNGSATSFVFTNNKLISKTTGTISNKR